MPKMRDSGQYPELRAVVDSVLDAIITADEQGFILAVNPATEKRRLKYVNEEKDMDLTASAVMTKGVKTVSADMSVPALEEKLHQDRVTGYPVVDGGRLVGVVSRADLIRHMDLERTIVELAADYYGQDFAAPREDWVAENTGLQVDQLHVRDVMSPYLIRVLPTEPLPPK